MRVVTFGYQTWGHRTLEALLDSPHEVVLAVTHPPSDHAYEAIWDDSVEDLARANGIPVHLAKRPDADLIERVKLAEPDIIVANNWRTWLPRELFDLPPHGQRENPDLAARVAPAGHAVLSVRQLYGVPRAL